MGTFSDLLTDLSVYWRQGALQGLQSREEIDRQKRLEETLGPVRTHQKIREARELEPILLEQEQQRAERLLPYRVKEAEALAAAKKGPLERLLERSWTEPGTPSPEQPPLQPPYEPSPSPMNPEGKGVTLSPDFERAFPRVAPELRAAQPGSPNFDALWKFLGQMPPGAAVTAGPLHLTGQRPDRSGEFYPALQALGILEAGSANDVDELERLAKAYMTIPTPEARQRSQDLFKRVEALRKSAQPKLRIPTSDFERTALELGIPLHERPATQDEAKKINALLQSRAVEVAGKKATEVGRAERGLPPTKSEMNSMRKEFEAQSKDCVTLRDAFAKVQAGLARPSAAGDIAMIFNFMKMLDPQSVVREGEFATAQNAAGVPARIAAMYNRLMRGERLVPEQRQDFHDQARQVFNAQLRGQLQLERQYQGTAERWGADPTDIVTDFVGRYRPGTNPPAPKGATTEQPEMTPGQRRAVEAAPEGKSIKLGGQTYMKRGGRLVPVER